MGARMGGKKEFYSYLKFLSSETPYAKRMNRLRNMIFGNPTRPSQQDHQNQYTLRTLMKEPIHKSEAMTQYYPRHQETHKLVMALRDYGLFRDEHQDFKEEMIRLRTLRGKPPWNPKEKREAAKKKK